MTSTPSPVFLQLLADRHLAPNAVWLACDENSHDALTVLANDPSFIALVAGFPCLIPARQAAALPPDLLNSLQASGCAVIEDTFFQRSDEARQPALRSPAMWLDGHWFVAPPPHPAGAQSASRTLSMKLLQLVTADAETRDIEAVLRQDPTLSYHLLRLVNSLGMGVSRRITSFSQAILILGRAQLKRWMNLMLFAARTDDYRAPMLLAAVAMRSRTMELLAKECGMDRADQEQAFMAGMFSMLGILFGTPVDELIKPLQLSDTLVNAILRHEGDLGQLLQLMERIMQRDTPGVAALLSGLQLSPTQFTLASVQACQWMLDIAREVQG